MSFEALRREMIETQLVARGVRDPRVLEAFARVPRERFVPRELADRAYEDSALPIEQGQTISQPYMVAVMTESLELRGGERVLEVGTGSGYQAAILAQIAGEVFTVERHEALSRRAQEVCAALGYTNIHFRTVTDVEGWEEAAPFDGIVVTAGAARVPELLLRQLGDGARLVIPVGTAESQELVVVRRQGDEFERSAGIPCRFVPLVGRDGWPDLQGGAGTWEE